MTKPWGGRALEQRLGLALPPGATVGESWELYDRPEGSSQLRGSTQTVADLLREDARALVGDGVPLGFANRFPLFVKYIDAAERLSLQVHPGPAQAREAGDGEKSEAWLVLAAGPQARIVCGLRPGVTPEAFAGAAATAAVEGLVHAFRPNVGDIIYVPHGTVHAIGPDVVVLEVQQNSDITYRLNDWGRSRPTHLPAALRALRPEAASRHVAAAPGTSRLDVDEFSIERRDLSTPTTYATNDRCAVLNLLSGRGTLAWTDGHLDLNPGATALIPACVPEVLFTPTEPMSIVWIVPSNSKSS